MRHCPGAAFTGWGCNRKGSLSVYFASEFCKTFHRCTPCAICESSFPSLLPHFSLTQRTLLPALLPPTQRRRVYIATRH